VAHETLAVHNRDSRGKGPARRMRAAGRIPAVLYGYRSEPTTLSVEAAELDRLLRTSSAGINTLIDLRGDVAGRTVLIKELQREPVRGTLVHADFYAIDATESLLVDVPLVVVGTSVGVSQGALLEELVREIQIECLPDSIPDSIEVDVTALDVGDSIHVGDIPLPEGTTLVSDPEILAVSCVVSRAAVAEEAAEGEGEEAAEGEGGEAAEGEGEESASDGDSD